MRLYAERLEDRYMMSADNPTASSAPDIATAANVSATIEAAISPCDLRSTMSDATSEALHRIQTIAEFEDWLVEAAVAQYGHLFGQRTNHYGWGWLDIDYSDVVLFDVPVVRGNAAVDFDSNLSSTNVQVASIDEADLIETDGEYLYIISGHDLVIVEAGVGDELKVASRVRLDERPVGMYLSGNRLALISSSGSTNSWNLGVARPMPLMIDVLDFNDAVQESKPPTTTVTLLDVTNRAAPLLVQKSEMDGQLVTSRTVDGQLRLVLTNELHLPMPLTHRAESAESEVLTYPPLTVANAGDAMISGLAYWNGWGEPVVYETQEEYLARVRGKILDSVRPQIRSLALDGSVMSETPLLRATEIYRPESHLDRHVTTVATFDLTSNATGPAATATIMTNGLPQVYVDEDSVYVFAEESPSHHQSGLGLWFVSDAPTTGVWKFDIDSQSHDVELVASGEFQGTLLNQFAADEQDGRLRVVTQPNWSSVGQSLHVLEQHGDELTVVGSLNGIATNEQLYSVRFVENTVFFVTFRQTDPLFVVDLSNPVNPQFLGELHIPGFSDYLQPIDENHLLAIGRNADENTGQFQELQVSIFDVSDLTDPQLLHRYSFEGGRSTMTPATGNRWTRGDGDHHAISYFASQQIFALPIYTADDVAWFSDIDQDASLFNAGEGGLQIFRIDLDAGFMPLGFIEHDTLVERSVQIGDHLYAISSGTVTVHELTNPNVRLGELDIAATGAEHTALTFYEAAVETVSQTSNDAVRDRPALRADWIPLPSVRFQFKPHVRTVAFATIADSQPLDDELANAIAIDAASGVKSSAASAVDSLQVASAMDDVDDSEQPSRQLLARRSAFRPIATRLGS